jgi:hypothetical protein
LTYIYIYTYTNHSSKAKQSNQWTQYVYVPFKNHPRYWGKGCSYPVITPKYVTHWYHSYVWTFLNHRHIPRYLWVSRTFGHTRFGIHQSTKVGYIYIHIWIYIYICIWSRVSCSRPPPIGYGGLPPQAGIHRHTHLHTVCICTYTYSRHIHIHIHIHKHIHIHIHITYYIYIYIHTYYLHIIHTYIYIYRQ